MGSLEELAKKLEALGHPLRLRILAVLAREGRSMYLSEIAGMLGISRALAKIHLKKLEKAGLVKSRIVVLEDEARALRYYELVDFDIHVSPQKLKEMIRDDK
ncbi:helix-turn-helix transcriptional regulator [Desulfurococcaceae archaeon MEX13E-LK6-19]|nr:helix-turn-helix transcriptional regulator [Desulfurococcaceae archaeon MEX13E-LK6-19]